MLLTLHPENPQPRNLKIIAECIKDGGIIIYPTDTIYGIGCDIFNKKAIERICKLKDIQPEKANLSFICKDLSNLNSYAKNIDNPTFRLLKKALPGPYTFILEASREVPKVLKSKKDTVGIRIPYHIICQQIIDAVGNPIMSTSIPMPVDDVTNYTNPELIYEIFKHQVDIVIDGGIGNMIASTVIDCSKGEPELIREGAGVWPII